MASFYRFYRRLRYGRPIVVVSGLPRSGTSMTMKMLEAGGLEYVSDGVRTADEDNPKGYYEDERVKDLEKHHDRSWLKEARGKAIKIISQLVQSLPEDNNYQILFMRRDLHEVLASQRKMLERRGEDHDVDDEQMLAMYRSHLEKVEFMLRYRRHLDAMYIDYRSVINNPREHADRINHFLGGSLAVDRMAGVVDEQLYRNRS